MIFFIIFPNKKIKFKIKLKIIALIDFFANKLGVFDLMKENIEVKDKKLINKYIRLFSK